MNRPAALAVGLVVNPLAGVGGAVGLMGSDGALQQRALEQGAVPQALNRISVFLQRLAEELPAARSLIHWHTWDGLMGARALEQGWAHTIHGAPADAQHPHSADTRSALAALQAAGVDLILFAGGDGTARDVLAVVGQDLPVLGIPAGVKMHSGVFAVSPTAAARVLARLLTGGMVAPLLRQVRDFDERPAAHSGAANAIPVRTFGELKVPDVAAFLQHTKVGGVESEPLAVEEICADIVERHAHGGAALVLGPGSTCFAVKQALGINGTLRGFDLRHDNGRIETNVSGTQLVALQPASGRVHLILSFTREQGFLLGRGNQQLDVRFLRRLDWAADVTIVGTRTKLASLNGRPLLVDTSDEALDRKLSGLVEVTSGYEDRLMYRVAADLAPA